MKLTELGKARESEIAIASSIPKKGGVDTTIAVDKESMRVVENGKLCTVLKKIGVRFVPVSYGVSEKIFVSLEDMGFSKILNLVDTEFSWIQKSFSIRVGQRL